MNGIKLITILCQSYEVTMAAKELHLIHIVHSFYVLILYFPAFIINTYTMATMLYNIYKS